MFLLLRQACPLVFRRSSIIRITTTSVYIQQQQQQQQQQKNNLSSFSRPKFIWDTIPKSIQPYIRLSRIDKPIGSWLLFLPGAWGIAFAGTTLSNFALLGLFGIGTVLMRGAGCTINDLWDREIDRRVERTKSRPIASGEVTTRQGLTWAGVQLSLSFLILIQLNIPSIMLGILSLVPVVIYPLMKRFTYWPQLFLGITFNWGALMGFTAATGSIFPSIILPLYFAGIAWTLHYDTIYAHQDKTDDLLVGVKSTALRLGTDTKLWLRAFSLGMISHLVTTGLSVDQTWPYYVGLTAVSYHLHKQIETSNFGGKENTIIYYKRYNYEVLEENRTSDLTKSYGAIFFWSHTYFVTMKNTLIFQAAIAVCLVVLNFATLTKNYDISDGRLEVLFKHWLDQTDRDYDSFAEYQQRMSIFKENYILIQKLNEVYGHDMTFELNKFADLTEDEFRNTILMRPQAPPIHSPKRYMKIRTIEDLPDSFDWRDHNAVTPVKDQGSVGTCWAFSTVQNVEGQWALKSKLLTNLSVEQVVDCDGMQKADSVQADCGVYGGWPFLSFQYLMQQGGIEAESTYPYCAGLKNSCEPCNAPGYNKTLCGPPIPFCYIKDSCETKLDSTKFISGLKVVDWKAIEQDETIIATALMNTGPLSVALDAEMLQFYHKGIFNPVFCNPKNLDHAVLLVGWGKEGSKPYWIVKNSWGAKWGEEGYFRILRGKGTCGINTQVTTAVLA
ncbi:unnamed protein product [Rotaria socialis]